MALNPEGKELVYNLAVDPRAARRHRRAEHYYRRYLEIGGELPKGASQVIGGPQAAARREAEARSAREAPAAAPPKAAPVRRAVRSCPGDFCRPLAAPILSWRQREAARDLARRQRGHRRGVARGRRRLRRARRGAGSRRRRAHRRRRLHRRSAGRRERRPPVRRRRGCRLAGRRALRGSGALPVPVAAGSRGEPEPLAGLGRRRAALRRVQDAGSRAAPVQGSRRSPVAGRRGSPAPGAVLMRPGAAGRRLLRGLAALASLGAGCEVLIDGTLGPVHCTDEGAVGPAGVPRGRRLQGRRLRRAAAGARAGRALRAARGLRSARFLPRSRRCSTSRGRASARAPAAAPATAILPGMRSAGSRRRRERPLSHRPGGRPARRGRGALRRALRCARRLPFGICNDGACVDACCSDTSCATNGRRAGSRRASSRPVRPGRARPPPRRCEATSSRVLGTRTARPGSAPRLRGAPLHPPVLRLGDVPGHARRGEAARRLRRARDRRTLDRPRVHHAAVRGSLAAIGVPCSTPEDCRSGMCIGS